MQSARCERNVGTIAVLYIGINNTVSGYLCDMSHIHKIRIYIYICVWYMQYYATTVCTFSCENKTKNVYTMYLPKVYLLK